MAAVQPGIARPRPNGAGCGQSPIGRIRRAGRGEILLKAKPSGAFGVDSGSGLRKYHSAIKERLSHSRIGRNFGKDVATQLWEESEMIRTNRRTLLKASAAFA